MPPVFLFRQKIGVGMSLIYCARMAKPANAGKNRPKFDGRLEFEVEIISHEGDDS